MKLKKAIILGKDFFKLLIIKIRKQVYQSLGEKDKMAEIKILK